MTVVRNLDLRCDRDGCSSRFYGPDGMWVDGPVRSAAAHEGWHWVRGTDLDGKDICPTCVEESLSLSVCPIPTK